MPIHVAFAQLLQFAEKLLVQHGVSPEVAATVAAELVDADAHGYPGHGVNRLSRYCEAVTKGEVKHADMPQWQWAAYHIPVDGRRNFGQVGMRAVVDAVAAKQKIGSTGPFTFGLTRAYHVGRLYPYARAMALGGSAVIMCARVHNAYRVAPFHGYQGRLGTNPIAYAIPNGDHPIVFDASTATIVEGKVRVAADNGRELKPDQLVDPTGQPTTDPKQLYTSPPGAILPLGGSDNGMTGYGLALFGEFFAGVLLGAAPPPVTDCPPGSNDVFGIVLNPSILRSSGDTRQSLDATTAWVRSSATMPGHESVLLPGERGERLAAKARADGVPLEPATVEMLDRLGAERGLTKLTRLEAGAATA